jgi:hypothetical protein
MQSLLVDFNRNAREYAGALFERPPTLEIDFTFGAVAEALGEILQSLG